MGARSLEACSVFGFLNLFDLLRVVEFFFVLFERLRQDGVTGRRSGSIKVLLQAVAHSFVLFHQLDLLRLQKLRTRLLAHEFVSEQHFVFLLNALLSLKVLLLYPSPLRILGLLSGH